MKLSSQIKPISYLKAHRGVKGVHKTSVKLAGQFFWYLNNYFFLCHRLRCDLLIAEYITLLKTITFSPIQGMGEKFSNIGRKRLFQFF